MPNPEIPIYSDTSQLEIERRLGTTKFACDLSVCKGACCTMAGAEGAPLLQSELETMQRVAPIARQYLSETSREQLDKKGPWQIEPDGSFTVPAIKGRDCVFVHYAGDVALCAIETAYRNGEIEGFPKPISCHLFPIRIYPRKRQKYLVCYEEIDECAGGRKSGAALKMPLLDFLEKPLVRALGEERLEIIRKAVLDV